MTRRGAWITIAALFAAFVLACGANGREIGTDDSRPSELAAHDLLPRGTLTLNHAVGAVPEYADRWGFILAKDDRYRAIYSPVPSLVAAAALAWSVAVAATGAFVYRHDAWNTDPADVDLHHERLWSISDDQIVRCWKTGAGPQNFALFDRAAVRQVAVVH